MILFYKLYMKILLIFFKYLNKTAINSVRDVNKWAYIINIIKEQSTRIHSKLSVFNY